MFEYHKDPKLTGGYKHSCKICRSKSNSIYHSTYNKSRPKKDIEAERVSYYRHRANVPIWANRNYILIFYQLAKESGSEVDHIVPINHPLVCGLHTEDNLQLATKNYNQYKLNRFWPDMPNYSYKDYEELYDNKTRLY